MKMERLLLPIVLIGTLVGVGWLLNASDRRSWKPPSEPPQPEPLSTRGVTDREALLTLQKENDRLRTENARLTSENAALRNSVARIAEAAREAEEQRARDEARRRDSERAGTTPTAPPPTAGGGGTEAASRAKAATTLSQLREAATEERAQSAVAELKGMVRDSRYPEGVSDALLDILLRDATSFRRQAAATLLGAVPCDERTLRLVAPLLVRDPDESVRLALVAAIGRWPAQRDVAPALLHALESDASPRVRASILDLLPVELPDRFLNRVLLALRDTDEGVRMADARLLGRVRAPEGVDLSVVLSQQMKTDRSLEVRRACMDALVARLGRDAAPLLQEETNDPLIGVDAQDYLDIFAQGATLPISQILAAKRAREEARPRERR
ncbi:MAG: HEAT repeat domain-containing protein [Planctomycetes bacterium]|nr:HEAT repeat domain-containing protein [Planctomycetota bacterium]